MSTPNPPQFASNVGLGYGIAITVCIVVLISTIILASYACTRIKDRERSEEQDDDHTRQNSQLQEPTISVLGLDKPVIDTYPMIELGRSRRLPKPNSGPCPICLSDYCANDKLRCIPECNHCFHASCIDVWLQVNASCPLCRNSPAATPITSTPLSQLVPLIYNSRS